MAEEQKFAFEGTRRPRYDFVPTPPPSEPVLAGPPDTPHPGHNAVWNIRDLLFGFGLVLVFFFVFALVIVGPFQAATGEKSQETLAANAVTVVVWDISMVLTVLWLAKRKGGGWPNIGIGPTRKRANGERWSWGMLAGLVAGLYFLAIFSVSGYNALMEVLGLEFFQPRQQLDDSFFDHSYLVAMIGFGVVFAAPIAEEIFFRGFIFAGLRKRLPFVVSGALSGFIFSLAHADPGLVAPFTIVGLILAYAYEKTGSLYASIALHFVFNSISFLALVFIPGAR